MGRTSDEEGETSAKTCTSDDSNDRPLKKARYVWQIKGKYHLKKPENEEGAKLFLADETKDGYTLHPIEMSHCDTAVQSLTVESATNIPVSEMLKPDSTCIISPAITEVNSNKIPEDVSPWKLQKWQARQVARCFVDNTINRVLEDMGFIPLPVDADDLMEDFAMSGRRNDHLEDAAVMMAIHSHGLQRAVSGMRNENNDINSTIGTNSCVCNFPLDSPVLQSRKAIKSEEHMKKWLHCQKPFTYNEMPVPTNVEYHFLTHGRIDGGFDRSQPCVSTRSDDHTDKRQDQYYGNVSENYDSTNDLACQPNNLENTKKLQQSIFINEMNMNNVEEERSSSSLEHTDFMDKAVAVAIQKKGLSTLSGLEYG